jgi:CRP-like cAMP-binding protein
MTNADAGGVGQKHLDRSGRAAASDHAEPSSYPARELLHVSSMASILDHCRALEQVTFQPGDVLLPQGGTTGCLYILVSGKLEVSQGDVPITFVSEPGSIVGELSLLLDVPHQVDVIAAAPSVCHVTRGGRDFLRSNPELALLLAEMLARRMKGMIGYLADLKAQYEDRKDHLGMVDEVLLNLAHRVPKAGR